MRVRRVGAATAGVDGALGGTPLRASSSTGRGDQVVSVQRILGGAGRAVLRSTLRKRRARRRKRDPPLFTAHRLGCTRTVPDMGGPFRWVVPILFSSGPGVKGHNLQTGPFQPTMIGRERVVRRRGA